MRVFTYFVSLGSKDFSISSVATSRTLARSSTMTFQFGMKIGCWDTSPQSPAALLPGAVVILWTSVDLGGTSKANCLPRPWPLLPRLAAYISGLSIAGFGAAETREPSVSFGFFEVPASCDSGFHFGFFMVPPESKFDNPATVEKSRGE